MSETAQVIDADSRRLATAYRVQVLDRALAILDVLAEAERELGPAELGRRLSLHKTTIHRLLRVLERHGFVRQEKGHGKYRLGVRLFELGTRALAHAAGEPRLQAAGTVQGLLAGQTTTAD